MEDNTYCDFCNDEEKMADFWILTKEEFLLSYSYLTEEEYDLTALRMAQNYVKQSRAYYEACGETVTDANISEFINDASNIFASTFDDYQKLFAKLTDSFERV